VRKRSTAPTRTPLRPVTSDDPAYLGVNLGDVVEAFLNLLADHLKLLRAEGATVQNSISM
jgi:hypothetical protein